jgi:5-(carboxyamino)imidazole ribonucleotide mutase
MGSDSDLLVMSEAAKICEEFGVPFEISVVSAHRTPEKSADYAKTAVKRGLKVVIAGAGGAAHLAGVIAAFTTLPVIAVPIKGKSFDGLDSLLSMVQMPPGIPVATVGINSAKNAGLLAMKMLGIADKKIEDKLKKYSLKLEEEVMKKAEKLEKIGYKNYLAE